MPLALAVLLAIAVAVSLWSQLELHPALSWNRDEPVYLWQAAAIGDGHLTPPDGGDPAAFHPWLSASVDGTFFSQYTLGWPVLVSVSDFVTGSTRAAIVLGALVIVLGTYVLAREISRDRALALVSAAVLLASPIFAIQGGVYLNYLVTAGLGLFFTAAALAGARRRSGGLLVTAGVLLGAVLLTRPFDVLLWAGVVGAYLCLVHWRDRRRLLVVAGWVAVGLAPAVVITLAYNAFVTGSATTFPITLVDPLDKLGFGERRIMPGFPIIDYTLGDAFTSTAKNGFWLPLFFFGSYVGAALCAVGVWLRRRQVSTLLLLALIVVFPAGYFPFFGMSISAITTKYSGPIYFVPLYAPLSILLASVIVSAWRRRRALGGALVAALLVLTVPIAVNRFDLNQRLSEAQVPWEESHDALVARGEPVLVFVADTEEYLLFLNPFSRNDAELRGDVLYAVDRGGANLDLITAQADRAAFRQRASVRVEDLAPVAGGTVPEIHLEPLDVIEGPTIPLDVSVTNPAQAPVTVLSVDAGAGRGWVEVDATRPDVARPLLRRLLLEPGAADRVDPESAKIELEEGSGEVVIAVGYGATVDEARASPAVQQSVPYRVVGSTIEILVPFVAQRRITVDGELQTHPAFDPAELGVTALAVDDDTLAAPSPETGGR